VARALLPAASLRTLLLSCALLPPPAALRARRTRRLISAHACDLLSPIAILPRIRVARVSRAARTAARAARRGINASPYQRGCARAKIVAS